jgi:hypothetical protein
MKKYILLFRQARAACCRRLYLLLLLTVPLALRASDLMDVVPVTNKILMVYIRDGHIDSYGIGQGPGNNITYQNATNLTLAMTLSRYSITSSGDGNYATAKNPINIGRKSKAVDYNDEWQTIPYVWGHWIYIELPTALVQGQTYTVQLNGLVENKNTFTFTYNVNTLRSETVHVNMVGFAQNSPKYAYLSQWMGDFNTGTHANGGLNLSDKAGASFRLVNVATGSTAFTGTIALRKTKATQETGNGQFGPEYNYTHADVWECNFSSFNTPGEYVVAVDGIGCSYPFEIGNASTRDAFYYAMKGLFWQRQGIVKEIEPGKEMPRDHHPDDIVWKWDANWPGGEATDNFNTSSPRVYNIWGYYHDAGDWDGYVSHAKVPMLLLLLFDLYPDRFTDGEIGNRYKLQASGSWINEGSNGTPDLLDEASWLINYYKRARLTLLNNYGGTGGVPGYVGRDAIPNNNIPGWADTREWYLSAENQDQTYQYAGLAAWYALCLNKHYQLSNSGNHPDYSSWISEATAAWNWANARPMPTDKSSRGFAAACLYRATTNTTYQSAFEDYYAAEGSKGDGEWSNPNLFDLAISVYALTPASHSGLNATLQSTCKTTIQSKATSLKVDNLQANSFRAGIEFGQFFDLGALSTPRMTLLPVAYYLSNDAKYREAVQHATSYALGGNQQNMTYLSKLGEESDVWIFNPDGWLLNDYNSKVYANEPMPGLTSYFGAVNYWFYSSAYSEYFSRTAAYPQAKDWPNSWPEGESKFRNRYSIQGGEFTVHQQNNYMIYAMGFVKAFANPGGSYTPNAKPVVSLNLSENQNFPSAGCNLTVTASADTRVVKYYYEWHYIGESRDKANNFPVYWTPPMATGTNVLITAVGYDDKGLMTAPTDNGDRNVVISSGGTCGTPPPSCPNTGSILLERYDNINGLTIADLTAASKYPASPDYTANPTSFESPTDIGEHYGLRMRGYLCPPTTGSYTFWVAGDDYVELWLSTNASTTNKTRIAYHTGWTNSREWNKYTTQKSVAITLQAGQNYYIEALMKEETGGDNLAVGWARPGESTAAPSGVIPGSALIPATVTVSNGLTHRWRLNGNGTDEIGTNHATLENGAVYTTTSKEGTHALSLAAGNGSKASAGTVAFTSDFTVMLWAYNTGDQIHQNWLISNNDGSHPGFRFFVNTYNTTDGKITFENQGTSNTDFSSSAAGVFPFNQWNLVTLVKQSNAYTIYVNGTSVHTGTIQSGTDFNRALYFGSMGDGNTWNVWKGSLDDIRIYNRALSASEVQAANAGGRVAAPVVSNPVLAEEVIQFYPNPLRQEDLYITLGESIPAQDVETTLTDMNGKLLYTNLQTITKAGTRHVVIDKKYFQLEGVYLVQISGKGFTKRSKIVVLK